MDTPPHDPSTTAHVDARVVRTRQRLTDAMFELIVERRWDKIRVQDLLDRTGTSRSAFYAHYDNKYDLLISAIPEFILPAAGPDGPDFLPLFEHIADVGSTLRPLFSQPVLSEITDTVHRSLRDGWLEFFDSQGLSAGSLEAEFLAGAVSAVAKAHILDRDPPPVQTAADALSKLCAAVLENC